MKKIFLMAILSMVLVSCSDDDDDNSNIQSIDFYTVAHDYIPNTPFLDNPESQNIVISDNVTWEDFLVDLGYPIDDSVDFETYQVISVFDQIRPDGGYSISVVSVTENQSNIIVSIEASFVEEATFQMPIQPYHIVKIPKSDKPVVFE